MKKAGLGLLIVGAIAVAGCSSIISSEKATEDFSDSVAFTGVTKLRVDWIAGGVKVTVDDSATEIEISGTITARSTTQELADALLDEVNVTLEIDDSDASQANLSVSGPNSVITAYWSVDVEVVIPDGVVLVVENDAGDVEIAGNTEPTRVDLDAGDVSVSDCSDDVDIDVATGEVTVTNVEGDVNVRIDAGDFSADDVEGDLTIVIGAGSVDAACSNGEVSIDVGTGDVELTCDPSLHADVEIEVGTGAVALGVADDFAADLLLQTSWGSVSVDLSRFTVTNYTADAMGVTATLNGGGGDIAVTVETGTIGFGGVAN